MAERQWTPQQADAIAARGGTVLVSAAAGSGKTAVLVERVVGRILDEKNPVDADRLLIVTFSNAAALEMKQRIMARMSELIAAHPEDRRLRRQQLLLGRAQVERLHRCVTSNGKLKRRRFKRALAKLKRQPLDQTLKRADQAAEQVFKARGHLVVIGDARL